MDVVGYCTIKKDAVGQSPLPMSEFQGQDVRVFEFDSEGGALVINAKATGIATFDKEHIYRKFECGVVGNVLTPPGLDMLEQTIYVGKVMMRKGGYNELLRNMVIQASLMKGKFNDQFLFAVQEQEYNMEKEKHEMLKDIKRRMHNGEKTTFAERNIVNIEAKKKAKKEKVKDENIMKVSTSKAFGK
jgi:hypothetical protein